MKTLIEGVGKHCPGAIVNMIANPVNSTVPVAAETLKKMGVYDKRKILGVTTLDVVRTFLHLIVFLSPLRGTGPCEDVLCREARIGCWRCRYSCRRWPRRHHHSTTLFSSTSILNHTFARVHDVTSNEQATPFKEMSPEDLDTITKRTQDGGTEVVEAKAGKVRCDIYRAPHREGVCRVQRRYQWRTPVLFSLMPVSADSTV